jgi:predicted lipid-binding transport protein (Tim44 family)
MADGGGLAIGILIILGFVGFVLWAKTPPGKRALEESFGAPDAAVKKREAPRKRPASSRAKPSASKTRPAAAKSAAKKTEIPVRKPRL